MHTRQPLSDQARLQYRFQTHGEVESSTPRFSPMSCTPNIQILRSRDRYKTCHIQLLTSGNHHWLPAIEVDGLCYSFLRVVKTQAKAIQLSCRLSQQGDRPILTQIPKGYAVWVLESDSQLPSENRLQSLLDDSPSQNSPSSRYSTESDSLLSDIDAPSTQEEMLYRVLTSQRQYSNHRVWLPGLDQTVLAVRFEEEFYSLFKTSQDIKQIALIVKKMSQRGDKTVVTRMPQGYGVWILEPQARLVNSTQ
ncbi:MAG: hypothetical protein WBA57_01205 [Elainellaceae cyanobacterium]